MKILIVDDNNMERLFLSTALKSLRYDIFEAANGNEALSIIDSQNINIVISDWMMPEMDGIELCQKIREKKDSGGYVYVIMVTSRSEEEDLMRGFEAGVDAYLQKPITIKLLNVQVKVGIRIINLEQQLNYEKQKVSRFAHEMETLANQRAEQLIHSDRMATLGVMAAGIAHEINNPATFINGNIQTFEKFWNIIKERLSAQKISDNDISKEGNRKTTQSKIEDQKLAFIIEEMPSLIDGIRSGTGRIQRILNGLKSYARQDSPEFIKYDIHRIIDDALLLCNNSLKYNITITKNFMKNIPSVRCDPQQIEQVFVNIFNNAADAMDKISKGHINIITTHSLRNDIKSLIDKPDNFDQNDNPEYINQINALDNNNQIIVIIEDSGPGLSKEALRNIWNPFFTTKPVGKGTGLGMSISHGIIKSHGGSITAENRTKGGARFIIRLPIYEVD
ncbi:MAG: response regulator [Desulfamplus sp.]|nr:response regulator [Desulfamplus sp.]